MLFFENIFMLIFSHVLADFVLQPEAMGYGKNRNDKIHAKERSLFPVWYYWLTAHALVHGGIVYMITGNIWLACSRLSCIGLPTLPKTKAGLACIRTRVSTSAVRLATPFYSN